MLAMLVDAHRATCLLAVGMAKLLARRLLCAFVSLPTAPPTGIAHSSPKKRMPCGERTAPSSQTRVLGCLMLPAQKESSSPLLCIPCPSTACPKGESGKVGRCPCPSRGSAPLSAHCTERLPLNPPSPKQSRTLPKSFPQGLSPPSTGRSRALAGSTDPGRGCGIAAPPAAAALATLPASWSRG